MQNYYIDIISAIISIFIVIFTITINYEIMRFVGILFDRVKNNPRYFINIVVLLIFFAHTISIWCYGVTYWILGEYFSLGSLIGTQEHDLMSYVYFSATTYSSLGFGDIYPTGAFRMLSGVEALNGLLLIGWSVTITYFAMQKFWEFHIKKD